MRTLLPLALVIAVAAIVPATALAQPAVEAEQLFRDAKALRAAKNYPAACEAFAASQRLGPSVSTLMNLADCRELNGELASAWALFLEVGSTARGDDKLAVLADKAKQRAVALEPRLSHLIINVPDESRVDGLTINRDGIPIDPLTWNRALPIDGGSYVVEGKAPGHEPWSTKIEIKGENDKQSVDVPRFKVVPVPDPVDGKPPLDAGRDDDDVISHEGGGMSGKRKAALGLGVVGVLGIGTGVVFEILARGDRNDAFGSAMTTAEQEELIDAANRKRVIAIGAVGVGVVCVGVAAYLWLTGGPAVRRDASAMRVVPNVGPGTAGLGLIGAF